MHRNSDSYLLSGQLSELERLQVQSLVWEPAARSVLQSLSAGAGRRVLDVGCGVMGWLRVLSQWVGPEGTVVGTDIDQKMLARARQFVENEGLKNISIVEDDLFNSRLESGSFDLVHSRFQIAPLGRAAEQVLAYKRLTRAGGILVLEDPDISSWRINPEAPATRRLIELIEESFRAAGGNFNSGRLLPELLRSANLHAHVSAHVVALPPQHPYLRLPLQFATSLRPRLEALISRADFEDLMHQAESELARPEVWGTTFTLIQAVATLEP